MNVDDQDLFRRLGELDPAVGLDCNDLEKHGPVLPVGSVGCSHESTYGEPQDWWPRLRLSVGAAVGLVVIGAAVFSVDFGALGGDETDGERSPAVMALLSAGSVARAEAAATTGDVSYTRMYVVTPSQTMIEDPFTVWIRERTEIWVRPDGSGRVRTVSLEPRWPSERDRRRWVAFGAPNLSALDFGRVEDKLYERGGLTGETREGGLVDNGLPPSRELPNDPGELRRLIYATAETSPREADPRAFDLAAAILMQPGATPLLKGAAYEVLAEIPGIDLIEHAEDPRGRVGTGITLKDEMNVRHTLMFDPGNAEPFAETDELPAPNDIIGNALLGYTVIEDAGQVTALSSRP